MIEDIAQWLTRGPDPAGFGLGRGHAGGYGVGPAVRCGCRRMRRGQTNGKSIRLEGDHRARAGGAAEQLGRRDEGPHHGAGGADPPQAIKPGAGGAGVVGKLDDGGVVVIHGVADPFREGKDCLGGAGVEWRPGDAVDAATATALPTDAAAARIRERGAVEQCPDRTSEAQAGEHLRQDRRRATCLLGIRDWCRAHGVVPRREAALERAHDLLGRALIERLRVVTATRRGDRAVVASFPQAGQRRGIAGRELFDHGTGGHQCHGHR